MKRKLTLCILVTMMCLTACGKQNKSQNTTTERPATEAKAPAADPYQALVGTKYKDFTITGIDGETHSLSEYIDGSKSKKKKRYVLVDFWATWCRPCLMEMPNIKNCLDQYQSKGFDVVGVSMDTDILAWNQIVATNGYKWHQLGDMKGFDSPVVKLYNLQYLPFSILCDKDGTIIAVNVRGQRLRDTLAELYK